MVQEKGRFLQCFMGFDQVGRHNKKVASQARAYQFLVSFRTILYIAMSSLIAFVAHWQEYAPHIRMPNESRSRSRVQLQGKAKSDVL
jgi:hypothetical protein